jgi:hypothetical protein
MPAGEAHALLSEPVVIEEKIDGANLGLSVGDDGRLRAQNRGQYLDLPQGGQFSRLPAWLAAHEADLAPELAGSLILFGEWCAARHSVTYDALPDWLLVFDIYDREAGRFWSATRRNEFCEKLGLPHVPTLFEGKTSLPALRKMLESQCSRFGGGGVEGVVIRRNDGSWLRGRAKLVRPDFTQAIDEHWRRRSIVWNRLTMSEAASA